MPNLSYTVDVYKSRTVWLLFRGPAAAASLADLVGLFVLVPLWDHLLLLHYYNVALTVHGCPTGV